MSDLSTLAFLQGLPSLFGGKQLGPQAAPFQPGGGGFKPTGLLGDQTDEAIRIINQGPRLPAQSIESLIGPPAAQGQELTTVPTAEEQGVTPPTFGDRVGGFFGNLDQSLQSPSKVIGMGLLNRLDPRLGAAGLLAGGLLGKNKVF